MAGRWSASSLRSRNGLLGRLAGVQWLTGLAEVAKAMTDSLGGTAWM